jgi:hypothetical protein
LILALDEMMATFSVTLEAKRQILEVCLLKESYDFRKSQMSIEALITPKELCPCLIHLEGRGLEVFWRNFFKDLYLRKITEPERLKRLGAICEKMHIRVPVPKKKKNGNGYSYSVTMDFKKADANLKISQDLVDISFDEVEKNEPETPGKRGYKAWSELFRLLRLVFKLLFRMGEWCTENLIELQEAIDNLRIYFFKYFDLNDETGYLHDLFAGHIRDAIKFHGSLAGLSGESTEALMAQMKRNKIRVTTQGTIFVLIYSNPYFILFRI